MTMLSADVSLISRILPPGVSASEWTDAAEAPPLCREEAALFCDAAPGTRRRFAASRACAHEALEALGLPPAPVLRGPAREPVWPPGVVGSITHCAGYGAAAVAPAADFAAVGIDAEPHLPLPPGLLTKVARPEERALTREPGGDPCWDRLLFSAKESVYKAWFPLTGAWLGFQDARVRLGPRPGTFSARLLRPGPVVDGVRVQSFAGRYLLADGLVVTAIAIRR